MKIAVGADHAGLPLKDDIIEVIEGLGHEVIDLGAYEFDPDDDYPDLAAPVARAVSRGQAAKGVILCGSGVGASIAANKIPGARASVCHDSYTAAQGVEHDNMNIICLGARVIGPETARAATTAFLGATMDPHPRFKRRLDKVIALETDNR
ncbi:MAG: RpiB/LacA/LacB family sugar-phosphate isomerase [Chloroflexi bacterium]|nr:RpiB/LacA/LacB family sugar-phosphate isomerase [Chloroflexota bacterium]MCH8222082.1 RpiB/LacA/LacB family sugar-phosphate isomerase [Chloroflexota bacterium]